MNKNKKVIVLTAKAVAVFTFSLLFIFNLTAIVEKDSETGNLSIMQLQASAQNEDPWNDAIYNSEQWIDYLTNHWVYSESENTYYLIQCHTTGTECEGEGNVRCTPSGPWVDCIRIF